MMNWKQLLSLNRKEDKQVRNRSEQDEARLDFEKDYDRIVFSRPFRMLQDKTQVVPRSNTTFVHTRLTHSLEVSVVGRSLGRSIGQVILNRNPKLKKLKYRESDFGAIVAAAALCHDIGNPPFGHSGENAIGNFFSENSDLLEKFTDAEKQDLIEFEGNANGFKMMMENKDGLNLTYSTIGAFMKYPKESLPIVKKSNSDKNEKFQIFQAQKKDFKKIAKGLGLISCSSDKISFCRHPLAYLVEAADDICYTIIDLEDAVNLNLIEEKKAIDLLGSLISKKNEDKFKTLKTKQERLSYFRAISIGELTDDFCEKFIENEELILKGEFKNTLKEVSKYRSTLEGIIEECKTKLYKSEHVINEQIAGFEAINRIMHLYVRTFIKGFKIENKEKLNDYDKMILKTIPIKVNIKKSLYKNILNVTSYIALLSDSQILSINKKHRGLST